MTRSKAMEGAAVLLFAVAFAVVLWKPHAAWLLVPVVLVGGAALVASVALMSAAERDRHRRSAWMVPVATVALAVQIVYTAAPEKRVLASLPAAALVVAGVVIAWARKRAR